MPIIKSNRLYLRPLNINDMSDAYISWLNDKDINQYLEISRFHHDFSLVKSFVESINAKENEFLFGIFLNESDKHIGNIKVGPINPYHRIANVSFLIGDKSEWGKGYAAEAIIAIANHAFTKLNINKLSAGLYALNIGSAKVLEKSGFKKEGYRTKHYLLNGKAEDIIEYGACHDSWVKMSSPQKMIQV